MLKPRIIARDIRIKFFLDGGVESTFGGYQNPEEMQEDLSAIHRWMPGKVWNIHKNAGSIQEILERGFTYTIVELPTQGNQSEEKGGENN